MLDEGIGDVSCKMAGLEWTPTEL